MHALPLSSPVGSVNRLKEFIRYLVAAQGSQEILTLRRHEIYHAAPQIGTIMISKALETEPIRLYKLESFESEWLRLAEESGFFSLVNASKNFRLYHKSSIDPYNTTYVARQYFNEYLTLGTAKPFDKKKPSAIYLRALCRIYLIDFICAGYELPSVCADIEAEVDLTVANLNMEVKLPSMSTANYFFNTLF